MRQSSWHLATSIIPQCQNWFLIIGRSFNNKNNFCDSDRRKKRGLFRFWLLQLKWAIDEGCVYFDNVSFQWYLQKYSSFRSFGFAKRRLVDSSGKYAKMLFEVCRCWGMNYHYSTTVAESEAIKRRLTTASVCRAHAPVINIIIFRLQIVSVTWSSSFVAQKRRLSQCGIRSVMASFGYWTHKHRGMF